MQHKKTNIWVEKLGALDLTALFIETLFSRTSVRYDENKVSGIAARSIRMLQNGGLCKNFYKTRLSLNKKNVHGYALNYIMENDLDNCLNAFFDKYIKTESASFRSTARVYAATYLTPRVTFITMVLNDPEFKDAGEINRIYIRRSPLNAVIIPYYRKRGYVIRQSILSFECLAQYLKPCYRLWSIMLAKLSFKKVRTDIPEVKHSIWVEYCHGSEATYPFWRDGIDTNMFDIVCYLDRNDNIPFDEQVREIENQRLKWIDLYFNSLVKLSGIGFRELIDMGRAFISCPSGYPFWFRVFSFEFRMWYLLYKPVFIRFKVKVLIQHQDSLWIKNAQLAALEAAGGIMIGFHWSNIPYYKTAFFVSHPHHVFFVWGKLMHDWLVKRGNNCHYILPCGLWIFARKEERNAMGLKNDLRFVIAVFDSSVAYNSAQSPVTMAEFYLRILTMLEKNPDWGGLLKSKNWSQINDLEFLPNGKEIVSRATALIAQKRLVFLNIKISPVKAFSNADISICYGLNSAGIISGIHDHRAVHWDCSGWLNNPFYRDKDQKFIFTTLDGLEDAVVKVSRGDTTIGDFSAWKNRIDHFGDESGPRRVGEFINDYMIRVTDSGDVAHSIAEAAKIYCDKNCIDDSFFTPSGAWEDEKIGRPA